jgi:YD repeat-containing protein
VPASRAARLSRLGCAFACATLVACGGGGGSDGTPTSGPAPAPAPSPSPAPAPSPAPSPAPAPAARQLQRIDYDYDGNGTTDASEAFSFDAQGRLTERRYTYTGDGTADIEAPLGDMNYVETIQYDGASNRARVLDVTFADASGYSLTYTYDGSGRLTRFDTAQRAAGGAAQPGVFTTLSYTGSDPTTISTFQTSGAEILRETLTYDGSGRPLTAVRSSGGTVIRRNAYEWNADSTLARETTDTNNDGVDERDARFEYSSGRLTRMRQTFAGSQSSQAPREFTFSYDGSGGLSTTALDIGVNGSSEMRTQVLFSSGPCQLVVLPVAFPSITHDGYSSSARQEWNFCAP